MTKLSAENERRMPESLDVLLRQVPDIDAASLSQAVLSEAAPLMARRASNAWFRQVVLGLALALLPLPLVAYVGATVLASAYAVAVLYLPTTVVLYGLATYAAGVALMIGATYAWIPIALASSPATLRWQQS